MPADRSLAFAPRSPVRSLAYRTLLALAHGLYKLGNGALLTAAGLLRRDELQAASIDQYRLFNVSAVEVDSGLSGSEREFYGRHLRAGDRILLAGSGTGRDLIALLRLGHEVTGVEPVAEVVEIARQHLSRLGLSAPMKTALIQEAVLTGVYEAIIFSNGCYSLLQGSALRVETLRRMAVHLAPGGRIIASYHPARQQSRLGRSLTAAAARVSGADWRPEPGDSFSRDLYAPGLLRYHHAFGPGEFARECEAAGLALVADEPCGEGYVFAAAERRT